MSLLEKIEKAKNIDVSNINIENIKVLLEKNYNTHKKFTEEIEKFINEYNGIAKAKNIENDLVTLDGMLFLKDLVEINYSFCFDDFDDKTLSILPLFFISFEKNKETDILEDIIPNICTFSKEIDLFLNKYDLAYGGYVVFGEKRYVPSDLEVERFITIEEFSEIIEEAKLLCDKYLPLFIEDLENFVLRNGFKLVIPKTNDKNKSKDLKW